MRSRHLDILPETTSGRLRLDVRQAGGSSGSAAADHPRARLTSPGVRSTWPRRPRVRRPARRPAMAVGQGLDGGPDTIAWILEHRHGLRVGTTTIHRYLRRAGLVTPQPQKRPRSSYVRFQADQPNETWQADFTHYSLATGEDSEILSWLDDHARYALSVTAHVRVTGPIVVDTFLAAVERHGPPASTLTDNGMVFTTTSPPANHPDPHQNQHSPNPNEGSGCPGCRGTSQGGNDGTRTHDPLLAKHSGVSVVVRGRQPESRSQGVAQPTGYASVRAWPGSIGSPVGSPGKPRPCPGAANLNPCPSLVLPSSARPSGTRLWRR
jgi:transposase InsO family protein